MAPQRGERGFSLIELMVVLTLLSIIALIAIPIYQRIDVRMQVSMGINFIKPLRYADNAEFAAGGSWPQDDETGGMPHSNELPGYIQSIALARVDESNIITITYDIAALGNDNTLVFYTDLVNGVVTWRCDMGSMADAFRPHACKG